DPIQPRQGLDQQIRKPDQQFHAAGNKDKLPERKRNIQSGNTTALATKSTGYIGGRICTKLEFSVQPPRTGKIQIRA
ncbi:MAG: hypothetical protein ACK56I_06380, partial [bacterium]